MRRILLLSAALILLTIPAIAQTPDNETNLSEEELVGPLEVNQTNETNATNMTGGNMTAPDVDTVMIASSATYADALVASAAMEKYGAPILLVDTQLPAEEAAAAEAPAGQPPNDTATPNDTGDGDGGLFDGLTGNNGQQDGVAPEQQGIATAQEPGAFPDQQNQTMQNETRELLDELDPDEVVIVGGPVVVPEQIETTLADDGYDVTRLWGFSRFGTAVDVANYFWPEGADSAYVVQTEADVPTQPAGPGTANDTGNMTGNDSANDTTNDTMNDTGLFGGTPPTAQGLAAAQEQDDDGLDLFDGNDTDDDVEDVAADTAGDGHRTLATTAALARDEQTPIYLRPDGSFPAVVHASLLQQGVDNVSVVGQNLTDEQRQRLEETNVTVNDTYTGTDTAAVQQELGDALWDQANDTDELVLVASDQHQHSLVAMNALNATVIHADDAQETADRVNASAVENVTVVGTADRAQSLADTIEQEANVTADLVTGDANETAQLNAEMIRRHSDAFAAASERAADQREQLLADNEDAVQARTIAMIQRAESLLDENASQTAQDAVQDANDAFQQEDYFEARRHAQMALHEVRMDRYRQVRDVDEQREAEVRQETQDLDAFIDDLRQTAPDAADQLENRSTEQLLIIVDILREHPRDRMQDVLAGVDMPGDDTPTSPSPDNATGNATNTTNMTNTTEDVAGAETTPPEDTTGPLTPNTASSDTQRNSQVHTMGQSFEYTTSCLSSGTEEGYTITGENGAIAADGTVTLPTPNYAAASDVTVNDGDGTVTVDVAYTEEQGVGAQCVGESTFTQQVDVDPGAWTVDLTVTVADDTHITATEQVQVDG